MLFEKKTTLFHSPSFRISRLRHALTVASVTFITTTAPINARLIHCDTDRVMMNPRASSPLRNSRQNLIGAYIKMYAYKISLLSFTRRESQTSIKKMTSSPAASMPCTGINGTPLGAIMDDSYVIWKAPDVSTP